MLEFKEGEAGFGDDQSLACLGERPAFLEEDLAPRASLFDLTGDSCGINYDQKVLEESSAFLHLGYPIPSVLIHAVANGHSIDEAVFAAISTQPGRADEIYDIALSMLPYLPGWACGSSDNQVDYFRTYRVTDLPGERTVKEIARRYFKERKELQPFPDWPGGDFHMLAPVNELMELAGEEYWYRHGPAQELPGANPRTSIMVALYDSGDRIVIDSGVEKLQELQRVGVDKAPVVFFYNREQQRPVSEFEADVKLKDIIYAYFSKGIELTHPPLWQVGDYHLPVAISELEELFHIPSKDEIGESAYSKVVERLKRDGFKRTPIMVTLLGDTNGKFLAEAARVRAAADLGMTQVPTIVFYHSIDRLRCGAPASCLERICNAATCAGASQTVCSRGGTRGSVTAPSFAAPGGGGGGAPIALPPVVPPPPVLPPSPGGPPR